MVRVELDHAGIAELLKSRAIAAEMERRAEKVAEAARVSAPAATGAYRDSIRVEEHVTDRAVARAVAGTDHAGAVEARTGNMARAATAARAT